MKYRNNINASRQPICELNTTPLIDVMLVLLIMFIMVLPAATHKLPVDLPQGNGMVIFPPPVDRVDIFENGALSWNGAALSDRDFALRLASHVTDGRHPELQVATEAGASYDRFHAIMKQIRVAGVTRLGLVKNAEYQIF